MSYRMNRYVISRRPPGTSDCSITVLDDGTLRFDSPWDMALKDDLKATIPATDRRPVYDGRKFQYWAVAPKHAETLADLAEKHGMGRPVVPPLPEASRPPEFDVLDQHVAKWKEDDPWDVAEGDDPEFQDYGAQYLYPDHQYRVE